MAQEKVVPRQLRTSEAFVLGAIEKDSSGTGTTSMVVYLVVGRCTEPCPDGGGPCTWDPIPHRYLEPDEKICFTIERNTSSDGSTTEHKVIVKKEHDG